MFNALNRFSGKMFRALNKWSTKKANITWGFYLSDVRLQRFFIPAISWHLFSPWQSSSKLGSAHLA